MHLLANWAIRKLLAWSGWRVQLGTLEIHQVPAYMTWAAALPARWLAVMVRNRGGGD